MSLFTHPSLVAFAYGMRAGDIALRLKSLLIVLIALITLTIHGLERTTRVLRRGLILPGGKPSRPPSDEL